MDIKQSHKGGIAPSPSSCILKAAATKALHAELQYIAGRATHYRGWGSTHVPGTWLFHPTETKEHLGRNTRAEESSQCLGS